MTTMKVLLTITLAAGLLTLHSACKKESEEPAPAAVSSKHGSTVSHNAGQPCLDCHKSGGSAAAKGVWALAGTLYSAEGEIVSPNGWIYLWSGPSGTGNLIATLEVDGNGNFYTTSPILPGSGAYMQVKSAAGTTQSMPALNTSGNCNGCHGVTVDRIRIK